MSRGALDIYESAGSVFSETLNITATDIVAQVGSSLADNATTTFTIPVKAGQVVDTVGVKLITAFDDSGSGDELDVSVGDGSDADGYITNADIHTDQTEITYVANTGAYVVGGSGARGKLYTADDTIDIVFTPNVSTGTDYSLSELTAGELEVKVFYKDLND